MGRDGATDKGQIFTLTLGCAGSSPALWSYEESSVVEKSWKQRIIDLQEYGQNSGSQSWSQLWGLTRKVTSQRHTNVRWGAISIQQDSQTSRHCWDDWESSLCGWSSLNFPFQDSALKEEPPAGVRVKSAIESQCSLLCYPLTSLGPHLLHLFPKHRSHCWALGSALLFFSGTRPDSLLWMWCDDR